MASQLSMLRRSRVATVVAAALNHSSMPTLQRRGVRVIAVAAPLAIRRWMPHNTYAIIPNKRVFHVYAPSSEASTADNTPSPYDIYGKVSKSI